MDDMYKINIYDSILKVEKDCWDSLTVDNLFMCYDWFKTFEEGTIPSLKSNYIMIFDNGKLIGSSVCYLEKTSIAYSIDNVLFGRLKKFKLFKNSSFLPALICNPQKGFGTHLLISKDLNRENAIKVQNELITTIENIANENKISTCFCNVIDNETDLIDSLNKRGYSSTIILPLSYIDIKWSSFEDYKKYVSQIYPNMKKSIYREINKNRSAGVVIKQLQNVESHGKRLFELLEMNHRKYNSELSLKPDFFYRVKENFGDDAFIYTALKEEKIIGVHLEIRKGKEAICLYTGIDHFYSKDDLTYFNIAYYEPIKNAISNGLARIY